ncbi:unnamed protein product [Miscanthus lutarioriparius]|uniref:Uncharacterized protein n=1 Tax=Miscanthus lutarioriparius TaxID=422564 RepID=A0A811QB01_9POAL|nr:unnamed protein product [Miscanthus lutarioriparius]
MVVAVCDDDDEADALVSATTVSTWDAPVVRSTRAAWVLFVEESRRLWAIGTPIAFNNICLYGTNSTEQIFVGHIGNHKLSAPFGVGQVAMLGVYMQRSWIMLASSVVPLMSLYMSMLRWGVTGATLAYDVSSWLTSLAQVAYVMGWCWDGWTGLSAAIEQHEHQRVGGDAVHRPQHGHQLAMVLVLAMWEQFPAIFTGDRHLQKAMSSIAYLLAVTMVLNSVQLVISGIAVGGGW